MSVFTPVTAIELTDWLKQYSVGGLLDLQGIAAGIENTNYFVTTSQGQYVLTLFEKLTEVELPFYTYLMAHLAQHGIPCPAPIAVSAVDDAHKYVKVLNGKPALLVTRLSGESITQASVTQCAVLGAMLAKMHVAGQSYKHPLVNPRGFHWLREAAVKVLPFLDHEDTQLLNEEVASQTQYQCSDNARSLPQGVIHGDLFRDNVLFDDHGAEKIGGIIDFYFACNDSLLLDVAITVNDWCSLEDGALDTERAAVLLRAYSAVRPFEAVEQTVWPLMLRAAALRFWLSRLFDYHLPRSGELTHAKDPHQYRAILKRRREEIACKLD